MPTVPPTDRNAYVALVITACCAWSTAARHASSVTVSMAPWPAPSSSEAIISGHFGECASRVVRMTTHASIRSTAMMPSAR